ncbi:MAG: hypothetical protein ACJA0N_002797 [Pseudohongiellaceae bacterium]|jgi:hypothetical protein
MIERVELGNSFGNYLLHGIDEVILPESISLMPQTVGWKIVGVLLIAYILWRSFLAWRLWQKNWYRREGLKVLADIRSLFEAGNIAAVNEVPALLKSVALQAYPRGEIAQLSGEPWIDFLHTTLADKKFDGASILLIVAYSPMASWPLLTPDIQTLFDSCESWITSHVVNEAGYD